jgi:PadR family transcriptional regulator, regulatory protein PadR
MSGMAGEGGLTELRRGVLGPCVLALLELRPRFGLELVRDLSAADGLLTSDGTVYPLLNRLRDAGLVTSEWRDDEGERARRYYSITTAGQETLTAFRSDWGQFAATVGGVLNHTRRPGRGAAPAPAPAPAPDSAPTAAVTAPGTKGRRR